MKAKKSLWYGLAALVLWEGPVAAAPPRRTITIAAYTAVRPALAEILPRFAKRWKEERGEEVRFIESYGASGTQARSVIDGMQADLVLLGLAPDVERIAGSGMIAGGWRDRAPGGSIVARSRILLAVRGGNPRRIESWGDLSRPGVEVVLANPRSSGGARWAAVAAHEAGALAGMLRNAIVLEKDTREAIHTFVRKRIGDVVPIWESDAVLLRRHGVEIELVVPSRTVLAEIPVAVVDRVVDRRGSRDLAEALRDHLFSAEAQDVFARHGLAWDLGSPAAVAASGELFTVEDLGGWPRVESALFEEEARAR